MAVAQPHHRGAEVPHLSDGNRRWGVVVHLHYRNRDRRIFAMTRIMLCKCDHKFQNREYGPQKRVFNQAKGKGQTEKNRFRCSVCEQLREGERE
jgi:hypothetical protein